MDKQATLCLCHASSSNDRTKIIWTPMPLPLTNLGMGALLWPVLSLSVAKQLLTTFVLPRTIQSHFCLNYWTKCFGKGHGSCHWGFESRRITHAWHTWFICSYPFINQESLPYCMHLFNFNVDMTLTQNFYSKKYLKIRNFLSIS